jgi:hypothetical protein
LEQVGGEHGQADVPVRVDVTPREQQGEGLFVVVGDPQGDVAERARGTFSGLKVVAGKPTRMRSAKVILAKEDQGRAGFDKVMGERVHERGS